MSMNKKLRKSLIITLGLTIGGFCATTNSIYAAQNEMVNADSLNVRKGPSIQYETVGSLQKGSVIEILETKDGWSKIKLSEQKEGWVSSDFTVKEKGSVTASKLNIRKGPSTENDKIGSLEKGKAIEILETENNWFKIKLENKKTEEFGWVSSEHIFTESQKIKEEKQKALDAQNTVKNNTIVSNVSSNQSSDTLSNTNSNEENTSSSTNGRTLTVNASAYSGHTITATGTTPKWGTIAVDPSVIPYGTKVYIPMFDKVFIAEDCGGAIKGNKIDIFMNSEQECVNFGRKNIEIKILG
ncbi:SH3 domain-containing protein [Romboutsia lituseburensis]|uniref:SH3 domain-containing protein n=1 Tax=Romboutsia lituseburensis TaxID=1537 RepID=UPI00215A4910|nr:SH3 domain-containing protein [Romboutsia lituseburensis]MCR8744062.1 SH3 domain-containing protein [Romboutsia lituseburensis]